MKERIKELRHTLGLTQSEFAEKLGLKKQTVYLWESGQRSISDQVLITISKVFNASFVWLKDGFGEMFTNIPDQLLDDLANRYELSDFDKRLVMKYMQLSVDEREAVQNFLKDLLKEKDED